jgi:hypothetical protein
MNGRKVGVVTDVRLVQEGPILGTFGAALRFEGLIVNRHMFGAHMGFDRTNVRGPWLVKLVFGWLQRDPRFVGWERVRSIEPDLVRIDAPVGGLPIAEPSR